MAHDEIRFSFSDDEFEKFKLLDEVNEAPLPSNKPLIQMVPQILHSCYGKEDCERYFKPTSVVIGPLNHGRETDNDLRIKRDEEYKLKLAAVFIQNSDGTTQDFYKNVKEEINSLRSCYNLKEVEQWSDKDLAWMFLVDGCALLGFIVLDVQDALEDFSVDNDLVSIEKTDFFLLENQLPYRLLEILIGTFAALSNVTLRETKLKELSNKFITKFINGIFLSPIAQQQHQIQVDFSQSHHPDEQRQEEVPHLLDLLQRLMGVKSKEKKTAQQQHQIQVDFSQSHHPDEQQQQQEDLWETRPGDESKHWSSIGNVKELKDKGIRFKVKEKGAAITDIDFNDHCWVPTLTLAPIFLHNATVPLLLNLMAYELCPDFKEDWKITSHLSFLDSLIDNGEDVKDLRDAGVVHNGLGSDEAVAELFNKISGILLPNRKIDSELRRDIYEYCNSNRSHFSSLRASVEAKLTQTYFRSPWSFLVFLGALAGLIMTGMQTYSSFHENKLP